MGSFNSKPTPTEQPVAKAAPVQPAIEFPPRTTGTIVHRVPPLARTNPPAPSLSRSRPLINRDSILDYPSGSLYGATHTQNHPGGTHRSAPESRSPTVHLDTSIREEQEKPVQNCKFFLQGRCNFGDKCFNPHVPADQVPVSSDLSGITKRPAETRPNVLDTINDYPISPAKGKALGTRTSLNYGDAPPILSQIPELAPVHCSKWKAGSCAYGDSCRFVHDPEVQVNERSRLAKIAGEEGTKTIDHVVFTSTKVTFGAGASVLDVVTGFESCRVDVRNLPSNTTKAQVVSFFTQPGFDPSRFTVVALNESADGRHRDAIVIFNDAEDGKNAVAGLDDIEFGDETVTLEMKSKQGGMGVSNSNRDPKTLTITWPAPSVRVVATYGSVSEAQTKVGELDKRLCCGRRVRVALNQKPATLPSQYFNPASISITGLPVDAKVERIQEFSGSPTIRYLKPRQYDVGASAGQFQQYIRAAAGDGEMVSFLPQLNPTEGGMVSAKIQFTSMEQAKHVYSSLENKPLPFLGGSKCYVSLPDPLCYSISVPPKQYGALEPVFKSLADNSGKEAARVRLLGKQHGKPVRVEVFGSDKKAVGSLKVKIEQLVAGEKLQFWDRIFYSPEGETFLASVLEETNAFVRCERRLGVLKAFGEPRAVEEAKSMIKAEVERLASLEFSVFLKRASVRFFVDRGVAALKEMVGEDNVRLEVASTPCKMTIRGGEDARLVLRNLVGESLAPSSIVHDRDMEVEESCPICLTEIDHPFRLGCGHAYCNNCLRYLLTTACDTKVFPLSCVGDEGRCGQALPIPTIQKFLLPTQVNQLLEVAFQEYLDRHPQDFKYCSTPDCPQIHRLEEGTGVVRCPSCFASACVSCSEDHEGFSCEEWKLHCDPEAQERLLAGWAEVNENVRKCPRCGVWIEKNGGCNHMTCSRCKSHVCWKCMGLFESDTIYQHLGDVHGGAFDY